MEQITQTELEPQNFDAAFQPEIQSQAEPQLPVDFDARIYAADRSPEADERLHALDDTIRGYQAEHPFIEGATLFGSTAHGAAHKESDIDAFVFVDPRNLPEEFSTDAEGGKSMSESDTQDMGKAIQVDLMAAIGKDVVKGDEHEKNDVRVVLMNDETIANTLEQESRLSEAYSEYAKKREAVLDEYFDRVDLPDDGTTSEGYVRSKLGEAPEAPFVEWGVAALFHPAVGEKDKIAHFRGTVTETLSHLPQGQEIWRDIVGRAAMFEGDLQNNPDAALPETLEEATEVFSQEKQ